ncbi:histidinol-phosphate transaminase [Shewanella sp. NIFS-20-20]|uniref:pyridoxal phosphate-dependent aminotransferase n=1 Tax=Shewanella sp. NIFS-20-20 TaxID=2853806 RepID=UPI001C47F83A|nr:histidinol-phosphate transaminase [Shewanella sp. NIFS-20-20]MBV7315883.1 histidinol-phosphate aminotransferase family protein [Shewanella sp. NIFS-20-20]
MKLTRRSFLGAGSAVGLLAMTGCQSLGGARFDPSQAAIGAEPLRLNFNENSLGVPASSMQALQQQLPHAFLYPDAAKEALMTAIAKHHELAHEQLIYGNGSSEILKMAVDAMATADAQLIMPDPSYGVVADYAAARGIKVMAVPLTAAMQIDIDSMQALVADYDGPSIVYLCNPNNPTSLLMASGPLQAWLSEASPALQFIVDEAYAEYVDSELFVSAIHTVSAGNPHVVVARTFSKIYGLAGLRVGYGVGHPQMISAMAAQASIDNANLAGCVAATAALNDEAWLTASKRAQRQALALVTTTLTALGLDYLDCNANFIFHWVNGDTDVYQQRMQQAGILVGRQFNHTNGWNRLTLGTPAQMQLFCQTLIHFRQQGWI